MYTVIVRYMRCAGDSHTAPPTGVRVTRGEMPCVGAKYLIDLQHGLSPKNHKYHITVYVDVSPAT